MKVILLKDVPGTGKKEQILEVSDGFARNYLLPRKLGMEATASALNSISHAKAAEEHRESLRKQEAMATADKLRKKEIRLVARAGETGRLYGSITGQEVADALLKQHGVKVEKRRVDVKNIRNAGEYTVNVWLYAGITAEMTAKVEVSLA